jgi:hypothetical protein
MLIALNIHSAVGFFIKSFIGEIMKYAFVYLALIALSGCAGIDHPSESSGSDRANASSNTEEYGLDGYNRKTGRPIPAGR